MLINSLGITVHLIIAASASCFSRIVGPKSFYGSDLWYLSSKWLEECCIAWRKDARRIFNMSYQTYSFLVGPLSGQISIDEMLYKKSLSLKFVYSVMNSNNSIVAHIGQLIRQSAKSPIGGHVACFRYKFGNDVDDNVLKNLILISRYIELNGERNIKASIANDLQSMIEDNHVGFTRDELSYMLNDVCTMYDMTVTMQLAAVFYHSPC